METEGNAARIIKERLLMGVQTLGLSLLLVVSRYIEKKLPEYTRKNDEFNPLAKMTNSINCTKFSNDKTKGDCIQLHYIAHPFGESFYA